MHGTNVKILKKHLGEVRVSKGQRSADYFVRGPAQHSFACYFIWRSRAIGLLPKRPAEDNRLLAVRGYFFGTCAAILHSAGLFPPLAITRCVKSKHACFQKRLQGKKLEHICIETYRRENKITIHTTQGNVLRFYGKFREHGRQTDRLQRFRLFLSMTKTY